MSIVSLALIPLSYTMSMEFPAVIEGPTTAPLGCHRRLYTYRVSQVDSKGRMCWDHVSVMSCWGRCDSSEISDWKFPYKRSYHPVCVHAGRSKAVAMLRNCDEDAEPEARKYEYMEAISCNCHTCSTTDTSCEAPNEIRDEFSTRVLTLAGPDPDDLEY